MFRARNTVLHGIESAGTSSQRPTNPADGATYFDTTLGRLLVWDGRAMMWFDAAGKTLWSESSPRYIADHFNSGTIDSRWVITEGNDAQTVAFAEAASNAGYATGTCGNAGTGIAADGITLAGPLIFEPEEGRIICSTRFKIDDVSNAIFFFGLTDVLPSTTLELPFSLSGTTYTSNASDGCGFLWDPNATTDTLRGVGVDSDTDASHVNLGTVLEDATWYDLGLVVSTGGVASFYVNGVFISNLSAATSPGVDHCPILVAVSNSAEARTVDVAFMGCRN